MTPARAAAWLLLMGCGSSSLPPDRSADGAAAKDTSTLADLGSPQDAGAPDTASAVSVDAMATPDVLGGASFAVTWGVQWFGSPMLVSCSQAGTSTVFLRSTEQASNQTFLDRFPCEAMKGQTRQLVPGAYEFDVSIEDERGERIGYSTGWYDLGPFETNDLGQKGFELQSFTLAWSLRRAGQPTTCPAVGARTVELVARRTNLPTVTYAFPCADGSAATRAIPQGKYLVEMRLLGASGQVLAKNPPVPVEAGDERRATVPPVTFDLGP